MYDMTEENDLMDNTRISPLVMPQANHSHLKTKMIITLKYSLTMFSLIEKGFTI